MARWFTWRKVVWTTVALGVVAGIALSGLVAYVARDVQAAGEEAQEEYGGDMVEALVAQLVSESEALKARNHAIWALGHLSDARALPQLESLFTGEECDHATQVCQYELEKALANTRGESFSPVPFIL